MGSCTSTPEEGQDYTKEMTLSEYSSIAKTGDIILFSGNGVYSGMIKVATSSPWTHIGMVVKVVHPMYIGDVNINQIGNLYIIQALISTPGHIPDVLKGRVSAGVQMNELYPILRYETGKVYLRTLNDAPEISLTTEKILSNFLNGEKDKPYEGNIFELVSSAQALNLTENFDGYFCSELVARLNFVLGYAKREENDISNNFTPDSWSGHPNVNTFKYIKGISLGPVTKLKLK